MDFFLKEGARPHRMSHRGKGRALKRRAGVSRWDIELPPFEGSVDWKAWKDSDVSFQFLSKSCFEFSEYHSNLPAH